jgi:hypothetical protein
VGLLYMRTDNGNGKFWNFTGDQLNTGGCVPPNYRVYWERVK